MITDLDMTTAYTAHAPRLRLYILARVGDVDTADDLLSQVWECACRDADRYQDRGLPVSSWLYRIAHCRIADHYRALRSRGDERSLDSCMLSDDGGMLAVESRLAAAPLVAAIRQLPTEQRAVIVARFLLQQDNAEVSAQMGISVGAVKALQHRGLCNLRKILSPPEVTPIQWCRVCGERAQTHDLCARHYSQERWHRKKGQLPRWERRAAEDADADGERRRGGKGKRRRR